MRLIMTVLMGFGLLNLAAACCGNKSTFSCCGKGKCNVFCCNCNGGCLPTDECKAQKVRVCIPIGKTVVCRREIASSLLRDTAVSLLSPEPVLTAREELEIQAKDEEQLAEVDTQGKGGFTFEEFLVYKGVEGSVEAAAYFDMYDRNGDGIITLDEMRLSE